MEAELEDKERLFSLELASIEAALMSKPGSGMCERIDNALVTITANGYERERPRLLRLIIRAAGMRLWPGEPREIALAFLSEARFQHNGREEARAERDKDKLF